jgi:ribonucleotide monophosphatase NagD (HAD superfamily)
MIGDNPRADIEGGKRMGWKTFLVKTGVYKGEEGESCNDASYIV